MTENKRFKLKYIKEQHISANLYDNKTFIGAIGIGGELIVELLNDLSDENEQLKKLLECSREEANDYCEELMEKDEFIRLYKSQRDDIIKENEQLKSEINMLKITIGRNEGYIDRLTHKGEWR